MPLTKRITAKIDTVLQEKQSKLDEEMVKRLDDLLAADLAVQSKSAEVVKDKEEE